MSYAPPKECKTLRVTQLNACRVNTTDLRSTNAVIEDLVLSGDMTARNLTVEYLVAEDSYVNNLAVANLPILGADETPMRLLDVTNDDGVTQLNQSETLRFASTSINVGLSKTGTTTSVTLELPPQPLIRSGNYVPVITSAEAISVVPYGAVFSLVGTTMSINGSFTVVYPASGSVFTTTLSLPPGYSNPSFAVTLGNCVASGGGGASGSKSVSCVALTGTNSSTFVLTFTTTDRTDFSPGQTLNFIGYSLNFSAVTV